MLAGRKEALKKALRQTWFFEQNLQTVIGRGRRDVDVELVPYLRGSRTRSEEEGKDRESTWGIC